MTRGSCVALSARAARITSRSRVLVSLISLDFCIAVGRLDLGHRLGVQPRVLPDVDGVQTQREGVDHAEETVDGLAVEVQLSQLGDLALQRRHVDAAREERVDQTTDARAGAVVGARRERAEHARVVPRHQSAAAIDRFAQRLGSDVGIAVAVAADPRAEAHQRGQIARRDRRLVGCREIPCQLAIQPRDGVEQ